MAGPPPPPPPPPPCPPCPRGRHCACADPARPAHRACASLPPTPRLSASGGGRGLARPQPIGDVPVCPPLRQRPRRPRPHETTPPSPSGGPAPRAMRKGAGGSRRLRAAGSGPGSGPVAVPLPGPGPGFCPRSRRCPRSFLPLLGLAVAVALLYVAWPAGERDAGPVSWGGGGDRAGCARGGVCVGGRACSRCLRELPDPTGTPPTSPGAPQTPGVPQTPS